MAQNWDEYAADWEKDDSTTAFAHEVFAELQKLTPLEGKHVLDFGCGTGLLTQLIAIDARDVVALDSSEAMIEELDKKELFNVEPVVDALTRGLVAQHPAFRKQFDVVVASNVCGYLADYEQAVDIIYSLLDEGGLFVHWDWQVDDHDPEFGLSEKDVASALNRVGFSDVVTKTVFKIQTPQGLAPVIMGVGKK